jgi:hypothetical protein
MSPVVVYLIEGQQIRAVELIILEVEGAACFKADSESSDIWWLDIGLLDALSASELALGVLRG